MVFPSTSNSFAKHDVPAREGEGLVCPNSGTRVVTIEPSIPIGSIGMGSTSDHQSLWDATNANPHPSGGGASPDDAGDVYDESERNAHPPQCEEGRTEERMREWKVESKPVLGW